ncbi:Ger(x)C family spore germination protein [Ectobacillus funiculus]|uniref:Ger(x)C family spore germination protein n=1 Tax=Ectobacillus funiculus TaxID=137993 RepID=UPI00397DF539
MRKRRNLLILCICLVSILSGCWSSTELNEMAIATAIGIDRSKEGYLLSVQVINPAEIAGKTVTNRTEVVTFKATGTTVFEALRKITTKAPRKVYIAHLREIVFGEKFAKEKGIRKALDFFSRDHNTRTDFFIVVAKNTTAYNVLKVQTQLEKIPGNKLFNSLEASENSWASTKAVKLDELISSLVSEGKQPVLTGVRVEGDSESGGRKWNVESTTPKTTLVLDNIGVFKDDKLIGWLSLNESKGFNYITDNVENTIATIPCEKQRLSIETIKSKTDIKGIVENGKPKILLDVSMEGNINDTECKIDLLKQKNIKKLEKKYANNIKEKIEATIRKTQEDFQSDIFGFGEAIQRADYDAWQDLKGNWDESFVNLEITVKVDGKIHNLGTVTDSF